MEIRKRQEKHIRPIVLIGLVGLLLLGLPLAVWLDLRNLTDAALQRQANDLNSLVTSVRNFYASNVVARVLAAPEKTQVSHMYATIPGAIPIPATLSLELGRVISEQQRNITYRFVSDFPFKNRAPHDLDAFERTALVKLRADPKTLVTDVSDTLFTHRVRLAAPIVMGAACVACHNAHPESPKHDWKIGDVRGIQEVSIVQPRQARQINGMNRDLESANEFLASLSMKISRYLSPQIYKSIFSGQRDVVIQTERKKLTIFFSDIKDFTATTERMQPEQITLLLNEYFTEMSTIALRHGGTIDKFVGDAMLIFFGDPETKGEREDAIACVRMAVDMQRAIARLNVKWRNQGVENPFRVRMGVNTGFCNVGNFGSTDRMDYTIIGAEANLAARLQSIAEPGHIVISYETFALARSILIAHAMPAITMKGINREIIPYAVEGMLDASGRRMEVLSEHMSGLDLYLDTTALNESESARIRAVLERALASLDRAKAAPA